MANRGVGGIAGIPFSTFLMNSLFVTTIGTVGCVGTSLFADYVFARIEFPGVSFFFGCVMITMMIPA